MGARKCKQMTYTFNSWYIRLLCSF